MARDSDRFPGTVAGQLPQSLCRASFSGPVAVAAAVVLLQWRVRGFGPSETLKSQVAGALRVLRLYVPVPSNSKPSPNKTKHRANYTEQLLELIKLGLVFCDIGAYCLIINIS